MKIEALENATKKAGELTAILREIYGDTRPLEELLIDSVLTKATSLEISLKCLEGAAKQEGTGQ